MSDFTSEFWNYYIIVLVLGSIVACGVLLWAMTTPSLRPGEQVETTGHVWDETLCEYNNPLPNWWRWLFYITIVFSLVYLGFYPGLGAYKGVFNWSGASQYDDEMKKANSQYGPIFDKYLKMDVAAVAKDAEAKQMGQRLFLTYCSQCHGSDARGAVGFPNLSDRDWLYGGEPDQIKAGLVAGRNGVMPAGLAQGDAVKEVANYVLSLSGQKHDAALAGKGKGTFETVCAACHGPEGKGNPAIGAPNLTDNTWLYARRPQDAEASIVETVTKGRNGVMPAWQEKLGDAKIHLLTAYVYGLSQQK